MHHKVMSWTQKYTCVWKLPRRSSTSCYQFSPPPLFQDTWSRVQLLCVDKAKPPMSAAEWQGYDQTDLQCQTARHCHRHVQWATCAAWHWGSGPHPEREKAPSVGMGTWNAPMLQPVTNKLMESMGLGGPRWHRSSWYRGIAESGSSRLLTLMIDIPGDLPRPRWLSWMRRSTGDQEVAGSTPAEVGNILSWRLIMKYFLCSFSPFRWFKKGSCQFLAKECAQYWLTA